MKVSKEEILHIAKLANLKIKDEEIEEYINNLQDILNFADTVNKAPIDGLDVAISATDNFNVFRKDDIKKFNNIEGLMSNAPEKNNNMFKIPKVI